MQTKNNASLIGAGLLVEAGALATPWLASRVVSVPLEMVLQYCAAFAALVGVAGLLIAFIGAQPKTRWIAVGSAGAALIGATCVLVVIPRLVPIEYWLQMILVGLITGGALLIVGFRRFESLSHGPTMFPDPLDD